MHAYIYVYVCVCVYTHIHIQVLHTTAGYMVWAATTFKYTFDYHAGDVFFCTADCGWITGTPQKTPTTPQKNPISPQKSPIFPQRALYLHKRALHLPKKNHVDTPCTTSQARS